MDTLRKKLHWENVFKTKDTTKVSWYQPNPLASLQLIDELDLEKNAAIMEVGAGDSYLADHLLEKGYTNLHILDISEKALDTIKNRLAAKQAMLNFIPADICDFSKAGDIDLWHDRAVFHFLYDENDKAKYLENASESIKKRGYMIISTFADNGPEMCSGLKVQRYSEEELQQFFQPYFNKMKSFRTVHHTPSGSVQNFVYGVFQRK